MKGITSTALLGLLVRMAKPVELVGIMFLIFLIGSDCSSGKASQDFASLFIGRRDTVGSPHGNLAAGDEAVSPNGKFLARLDQSRTKVELLDAKTEESLGIISDGGTNDPKAFAFSSDGSQLAVLYHNEVNLNTIQVLDVGSKELSKVISFAGRDYYHEMIWYQDGRIALLLQWRRIGAVINPVTEERVEGQTTTLPLPEVSAGTWPAPHARSNADIRPSRTGAATSQFVRTEGTHLVLEGHPFYFVGTNCYYLMTYAADPARRVDVDKVLQSASKMGLKVMRTWAFNDGKGYNALQTAPGVYEERVFQGLAYVIWKAEQFGLRLILVFVNNWDDYGGMNQYVGWSQTAQSHDDFYTDENTRKWFRDYVSAVLTRTNTFSGRLYKDDPTIMAWELANEPRASQSAANGLRSWIAEMSSHIESLDTNHLVATGSEGLEAFVEIHQVPTIDFCTVHLWPGTWHWDQERSLTWLRDRIREAHEIVRKPLILEEFGKHRDTAPPVSRPPKPTGGTGHTATRNQFYQALLNVVYESKAAGALFWILYHDTYPDYDGFGIYYPADRSTVDILRAAAARADALSSNGG